MGQTRRASKSKTVKATWPSPFCKTRGNPEIGKYQVENLGLKQSPKIGRSDFFATLGGGTEAFSKLFDTSCGIDKLLFPSEERVASGANPNPEVAAGGADAVCGPAGTGNRGGFVAGMNVCFHKKGMEMVTLWSRGAIQNTGRLLQGRLVVSRRDHRKIVNQYDLNVGYP